MLRFTDFVDRGSKLVLKLPNPTVEDSFLAPQTKQYLRDVLHVLCLRAGEFQVEMGPQAASRDLLQELAFEADVVAKTAKSPVYVSAHIQNKEALLVNLLDPVDAPKAKLEHTLALVSKTSRPLRHLNESDHAANFNHSDDARLTLSPPMAARR